MRIKKVSQTTSTNATIVDGYSESTQDGYSCNYINDGFGKILWTNPNPTSSFEAQNITLSSSNYDILEFYFKSLDANSNILSVRTVKGKSANLQSLLLDGTKIDIVLRTATYVNDTQYSISAGNIVQVPSTSNVFNTNTQCIPIYVIGYKTNLFN